MITRIKIRLMYLGIGLFIGSCFGVFQYTSYNEERTRSERLYESISQVSSKTIARLTVESGRLKKELKQLKQKTRIVEITNVDGSTSRVYENDLQTSTQTTELEYTSKVQSIETQMKTLTMEHKHELQLIEKSKPSAQFSLGMNTNLTPYFVGTYNFYGPFLLNGYTDLDGVIGAGLGLQF